MPTAYVKNNSLVHIDPFDYTNPPAGVIVDLDGGGAFMDAYIQYADRQPQQVHLGDVIVTEQSGAVWSTDPATFAANYVLLSSLS